MDTRICWLVQYNDGSQKTSLSGFKYRDIDRDRLTIFALLQVNKMKPLVVLHLTPDRRLIYRKRTAVSHGLPLSNGQVEILQEQTVYLVGWQQNVDGKNIQMLTALFEDGHIEVVDGFKEGHPWFDNVNFLPEERL